MAGQTPKLELPLGKAIVMEIQFDEPLLGEGKYGRWHAWGVSVGKEKFTLFPSQNVHEVMQTHGVKRGSIVTIRKVAVEREGKTTNAYDLKIGDKVVMRESILIDTVEDVGKDEHEEKGAPAPAAREGPPPLFVSPRSDARLLADYANALALELREWELPPATLLEVAQKIVTTYLIRALNEGKRIEVVTLPEDEEAVGYENPPEEDSQ